MLSSTSWNRLEVAYSPTPLSRMPASWLTWMQINSRSPGETVRFWLDPARVHTFDKATGVALW